MNNREMYRICKEKEAVWSDRVLKEKIRELGRNNALYWWDAFEGPDCRVFYNRRDHEYMNCNLEKVVLDNGNWITEEQYNLMHAMNLFAAQNDANNSNEDAYFSAEQLERIASADSQYNLKRFMGYGSGDNIYRTIGVLKDGDDDHSPSIGFEIETNYDIGCAIERGLVASEYLDIRLGHVESDSSISGVEFDSHPFTWNKLKKIKPLFDKQFTNFMNAGLAPTSGAGLHIHIGLNAFASERAKEKFYYLINCRSYRTFWNKLARRSNNDYARFDNDLSASVESIQAQMERFHDTHSVAVNQQHRSTLEIRIFQSTLSTDILYGCIEVLVNLVEMCNREEYDFRSDALYGDYVRKYSTLVDIPTARFNLEFMQQLSNDQLLARVSQYLQAGDSQAAMRLIQRYDSQIRSINPGTSRRSVSEEVPF